MLIQGIDELGNEFILDDYFENSVDAYDFLCDNYTVDQINDLKLRVIDSRELS